MTLIRSNTFLVDMYTILTTGSRPISEKMISSINASMNNWRYDPVEKTKREEKFKPILEKINMLKDMVEAVEWSYERAQKNVPKKDRQTLVEWLDTAVQNPEQAPSILRPHLQALQAEQAPSQEAPSQEATESQSLMQPPQAPVTNRGARAPTDTADILTRAASDPEFYAQNREAIKKAWRARRQ